jgi:hypothetical protein
MGRAYSISRREVHTKFWEENLKEKGHLENLCLDGRVTLKYSFEK